MINLDTGPPSIKIAKVLIWSAPQAGSIPALQQQATWKFPLAYSLFFLRESDDRLVFLFVELVIPKIKRHEDTNGTSQRKSG